MLNILKNTINRVFASGIDSDASAFITATGLSGTTQKSAITTLVKDLKASGLWSKMKAVYPMVTDNRNLFSYSEDFTNGYWVKNNTSVTLNSAIAPNGTMTADTLIPSAGTNINDPIIYVIVDNTTQTRTISFYAKSAGYNYAYARVGGATPVALALFDLSNGTVVQTQAPAISASIESVGNGWYRCQMVYPNSPSLYAPNIGACSSTYTISSTGITTTTNGTSGIYIWGAQLEASSTASTYQPIATTPSAFMASQMKYNLKDARDLDAAFRLTWSGGWTYSATGATPNGTNAYADTKLVPSSTLSSINNFHISHYSRTQNTTSSGWNIGVDATSGIINLAQYFAAVSLKLILNGSYSANMASSNTANTLGLSIGNIQSSTSRKLYFNNSLLNTTTNTTTGSLPNNSFFIGSGRDSTTGLANSFTPHQTSFSTIGDGLTDTEAFLLNQIVEKYQVALSRGVQAAQSFYYNSAYSNEANTYLYSTQITGTTQVSAINTLINGLKANNLWSKMKAVYPFVTDKTLQSDMATQMKFNLVNPQDSDAAFRLAFSGGWTYSTNGALPNGTNAYADTFLIPSTNLTESSKHLSFYLRTDNLPINVDPINIGALSGTQRDFLLHSRVNISGQLSSILATNLISNPLGYSLVTRSSTTNNLFKNNSKVNTASGAGTSATGKIFVGALNLNGGGYGYTNNQLALATIGDGLTDTEAALLYQLIQDYQTTLSRQV